MRLDHVIYGTPDLDDAAVRLEQEHGHPGLRSVGIAGPSGEIVLRDPRDE
jgi:hypothetical protein